MQKIYLLVTLLLVVSMVFVTVSWLIGRMGTQTGNRPG